ncbi:hypothetical protein [Curvibacter gracilis]|uniref:hypothetical protein n=1 Tax=Curvibacter gracilis TaxID=230310 RepID=UPI00048809EE|nr:hypothetical protein [Curvibacter gracilis]
MNEALTRLATSLRLEAPENRPLALAFCLACARRVEHLLEEPEVATCLRVLARHVDGLADAAALQAAASEAAVLANRHRGSRSIDGCGHAAVSASYGVAKALAGKAMEAAQYCAYAAVYASGGYAAVAERDAFESEHDWQLQQLQALAVRDAALLPAS